MPTIAKLNLLHAPQTSISAGKLRGFGGSDPKGNSFGFTNYFMTRNGRPWIPLVGEFHFSRYDYLYWEEELLKMKAGGIRIVATYVFWNHHEEEEGRYDWNGSRNLRHFIDVCAKLEMPLILRIGPFCHGEVRNGGIPDWVLAKPLNIRSNDPAYLRLARKLYRQIAKQMDGSLYQQGGPVIAVQLENEFMHAGAPNDAWGYKPGKFISSGTGGNAHLEELRRIADDEGIRPLFFTATAWGGAAVPEEGFLPMLASYAYTSWLPDQPPSREFVYRDLHAEPAEPVGYDTRHYPVAYCEMAGGMQVSYNTRPFVPPDSVEAMTLVKLASGSNLLGYYMYHGGSNPVGRKGYLNEQFLPKITYDYQAPLGEFGRVGDSWHRIRCLSLFLEAFGERLAPMSVLLPEGQSAIAPDDASALRWCVRHRDGSGFVFLNNFQDAAERGDMPFRIELETPRGSVRLPYEGEGVLPAGAGVALPFGLELHGTVIVSATVQPLTEIECAGERLAAFFQHEGMRAEYVLLKSSVREIDAGDSEVTDAGMHWVIAPAIGMEHSIRLVTASGAVVRLLTLSRAEALRTYRFRLHGRDTLAVSDGILYVRHDRLLCTSPGQTAFSVALLPAPEGGLAMEGRTVSQGGFPHEAVSGSSSGSSPGSSLGTDTKVAMPVRREGLFHAYEIEVPAYEPSITVTCPVDSSALLRIGHDWPEHVEDVWLKIDYDGDVAAAYMDGELLTDHIPFGKTWEIGLKSFRDRLEEGELHLSITPLRQGKTHLYINQAQVERFEGVEIASFRRIAAVPHYRFALVAAKAESVS